VVCDCRPPPIWFADLRSNESPPTISWIADQRIPNGGTFAKEYFRIFDKETQLTHASVSAASSNEAFIDDRFITWGICNTDDIVNHGCSPDGGYWIAFPPPGDSNDSATITLTVTDGGAK
jgi:hypothetical protein